MIILDDYDWNMFTYDLKYYAWILDMTFEWFHGRITIIYYLISKLRKKKSRSHLSLCII